VSTTRIRATTSPVDGLNPEDPGVQLLARAVRDVAAREILLVCSGDIPGVGREATRLVLDVRERVGSRAHAIPVTEPTEQAPRFGHAIVWPRSHLGKDFTHCCLAQGALALRPGGVLWCAVRKAKGAQSLSTEMAALMGEVDVVARHKGYRLLRARRTEAFDEARAREHLGAHYVIEDDVLPGLVLRSAPGVFSRQTLDAGTRQLIEHARALDLAPAAVVDLGCGVGPLSLWAAQRWPNARVLAVDSNLRAVALAAENAEHHGLSGRVEVVASDGMPPTSRGSLAVEAGAVELSLCNPPTHADPDTLARFARELREWLAPGGLSLWVVSRPGRMTQSLVGSGARVVPHAYPRYTVLEARWPARSDPAVAV